jgi:hypothetical protein
LIERVSRTFPSRKRRAPKATSADGNQRPTGRVSKGPRPEARVQKASVKRASTLQQPASLRAVSWRRKARQLPTKSHWGFGTIGRSGGPFRCASAVTVRCAIKHAFVRRFSLPQGILNENASPTVVRSLIQILGERSMNRRTNDRQRLRDCGCPGLSEIESRCRMIEVFPVPPRAARE